MNVYVCSKCGSETLHNCEHSGSTVICACDECCDYVYADIINVKDDDDEREMVDWYVWSVNDGVDHGMRIVAETPKKASKLWFEKNYSFKDVGFVGLLGSDLGDRVAVIPWDAMSIFSLETRLEIKDFDLKIKVTKDQ